MIDKLGEEELARTKHLAHTQGPERSHDLCGHEDGKGASDAIGHPTKDERTQSQTRDEGDEYNGERIGRRTHDQGK